MKMSGDACVQFIESPLFSSLCNCLNGELDMAEAATTVLVEAAAKYDPILEALFREPFLQIFNSFKSKYSAC